MGQKVDDPFKVLIEQYRGGHLDLVTSHQGYMVEFFDNRIPVGFRSVTFDLIDESSKLNVWKCLTDERPGKGLFLSGPVGTGKTSTLYVILKYLLWERFLVSLEKESSRDVPRDAYQIVSALGSYYAFVTHFELVRQLRAYYERSKLQDEQPAIFRCPLLFVDDLGRGYDDKAGWNTALLDEFFDCRYQHRRRIFASTNKTPQELRNWDSWERVVDRLCDPSWMYTATVTGKSKRSKEFAEAQGESR